MLMTEFKHVGKMYIFDHSHNDDDDNMNDSIEKRFRFYSVVFKSVQKFRTGLGFVLQSHFLCICFRSFDIL